MSADAESDEPLGAQERELAARLESDRPLPGTGFRGVLGRHLEATNPGYGPRPDRLRLTVGAYLAAGLLVLLLGLLQATGSL
jgi:hypothetical protein